MFIKKRVFLIHLKGPFLTPMPAHPSYNFRPYLGGTGQHMPGGVYWVRDRIPHHSHFFRPILRRQGPAHAGGVCWVQARIADPSYVFRQKRMVC